MEPVVYSNWAPGEPNDAGWSGSSEDCAVMGTNKMWNDVPCRYARAYAICESLLKPTTNLYTYAGIGVGVFVLLLVVLVLVALLKKKQENQDVNKDDDLYTYSTYLDKTNNVEMKPSSLDSNDYDTYCK